MASIYGYIRTSLRLQEGVPGMDPASQELQLWRAGVPLANIHRDVGVSGSIGTQGRRGWHRLNGRLASGDIGEVHASAQALDAQVLRTLRVVWYITPI